MIGDGRMPGRCDALVPRRVLVHRRRPGDVVHGSGAAEPALGRRLVVGVEAAARRPARLPAVVARRGAKPSVSSSSARLALGLAENARTASKPWSAMLGRNLRMLRDERRVVDRRDDEPVAQALRILEASRPPSSRATHVGLARESLLPEVERRVRRRRATRPCAPSRRRRARAATPGYSKNVMSLPGAPGLVRVEEVVDGRVVLVDRLLHEPQAEDARVEVDVARRVGRDARDVVDAVESASVRPEP